MTEKENIQFLVNARLLQASNAFNAGQLLRQRSFYPDAINRFYYSMFYAVLALLITKQLGTSKHQGAIALFEREFIKPGDFPKEMSAWLRKAFKYRLEADYADSPEATEARAVEIEAHAGDFIRVVKNYLQP